MILAQVRDADRRLDAERKRKAGLDFDAEEARDDAGRLERRAARLDGFDEALDVLERKARAFDPTGLKAACAAARRRFPEEWVLAGVAAALPLLVAPAVAACAIIKVQRAYLMSFLCARRDACVAMDVWSKFWRISAPACQMINFGTGRREAVERRLLEDSLLQAPVGADGDRRRVPLGRREAEGVQDPRRRGRVGRARVACAESNRSARAPKF